MSHLCFSRHFFKNAKILPESDCVWYCSDEDLGICYDPPIVIGQ